jgi:hypothetical protein
VYQPIHLIRALVGAKPWRAARPLDSDERPFVPVDALIRDGTKREMASGLEADLVPMALPIVSQPKD